MIDTGPVVDAVEKAVSSLQVDEYIEALEEVIDSLQSRVDAAKEDYGRSEADLD